MKQTPPRVGFGAGVAALASGVRAIVAAPKIYPYALLPGALAVLFEAGFLWLGLALVEPWVHERLRPETLGDWGALGASLVSWLSVVVVAALGWFVVAFITPVVCAPALEHIVGAVEAQLGVPPRAPLGYVRELYCGLRSMMMAVALTLPLILLLSLLGFIVPPLALLTEPSKWLLGASALAWSLFDYPLTLHGVGARARLLFMREHAAAVSGFGLVFTLAFALPCCGLLLLPVGVAAATSLLWRLGGPPHPRAPQLTAPR